METNYIFIKVSYSKSNQTEYHYHSDTALSISKLKAYLLQWLPSLQHALMVVVQQSRYSIFYDRDTPIQLGLL